MGRTATKATENIYFQCRKRAALDDPKLNSREGAAEALGVSPSTLADYELGMTKFIPVESIIRMADVYNAPFLKTRFCSKECPLGSSCKLDLPTEQPAIENVVLDMAASMRPAQVEKARDDLIVIARDGRVTEDERGTLSGIIETLDVILKGVIGLRLINAAVR